MPAFLDYKRNHTVLLLGECQNLPSLTQYNYFDMNLYCRSLSIAHSFQLPSSILWYNMICLSLHQLMKICVISSLVLLQIKQQYTFQNKSFLFRTQVFISLGLISRTTMARLQDKFLKTFELLFKMIIPFTYLMVKDIPSITFQGSMKQPQILSLLLRLLAGSKDPNVHILWKFKIRFLFLRADEFVKTRTHKIKQIK